MFNNYIKYEKRGTVLRITTKLKKIEPDMNFTKLLNAVENGDLVKVKSLLKKKININGYNSDYHTALHLAAGSGYASICRFLLKNGADPYIVNNNLLDSLEYAEHKNQASGACEILKYELKNKSSEDDCYKILRTGKLSWISILLDNTTDTVMLGVLQKSYDKIITKNLMISHEIKLHIELFLITSKYKKINQFDYNGFNNISQNDRLDLLHNQLKQLKEEMNSESKNCRDFTKHKTHKNPGDIFIFLLKMILKNLYILDQTTLKSGKRNLPWFEIKFLISLFIVYSEKQDNKNIIFKLILHKKELVSYIEVFLTEITDNEAIEPVPNFNLKFNFKKKTMVTKEQRKIMNNKINQHLLKLKSPMQKYRNKVLKNLSKKYKRLKNIHSLERILYQLKIIQSMKDLEGASVYAVKRALQVIGECLKSGKESPNISLKCVQQLTNTAPLSLQQIVTKVRNLLTHSTTGQSSKSINTELYHRVQYDLQQIYNPILNLLYHERIYAMKVFYNKILNCNNMREVSEVCVDIEPGHINFEEKYWPQMQQIKCLWNEFTKNCLDQTNEDINYINNINVAIQKFDKSFTTRNNFLKLNYSYLKEFFFIYKYFNNITDVWKFCLSRFEFLNFECQINFKDVHLQILNNTEKLLDCRERRDKNDQTTLILHNLFTNINHNESKLNSIIALKSNLEYIPIFEIKSEIEIVFDYIKTEFTNRELSFTDLEQKIEKEKKIHEGKINLIKFIRKNDNSESNCDKLKKIADQYGIEAKKLNQNFQLDRNKTCKYVENLKCNFDKLVTDIKIYMKDSFNLHSQRSAFELFFKSTGINDNPEIAPTFNKYENICIENLKKKCLKLKLELVKRFSIYFFDKSKLVEDFKDYLSNPKRRSAIEMILLEICEIIYHEKKSNAGFLDDYSPIIIENDLRNYLAHGNIVFEALTDSLRAIYINALVFAQMDFSMLWDLKSDENRTSAKINVLEIFQLKLSWIKIQSEMFQNAKENNLTGLKTCLAKGADMLGHDNDDRSILYYAIDGDCRSFISYVLNVYGEAMISILTENTRKFYDFILRDSRIVSICTLGIRPDLFCYDHWFLLHNKMLCMKDQFSKLLISLAIVYDYNDVIEMMLLKEDLCNCFDDCLLLLAMKHNNPQIIKTIINHDLRIRKNPYYFFNPLQFASVQNNLEAVKLLCNNQTDINEMKYSLELAVKYGHKDIVDELLKHKINISNEDQVLFYATEYGNEEVVKNLIEYGYNIHLKNIFGKNILQLAVLHNNLNLVRYFIEIGVDMNSFSSTSLNAINLAAASSSTDIIDELIPRTNLVILEKSCLIGPLHLACKRGSTRIVKKFIDAEANINFMDASERTPLIYAIIYKHFKIVKLMVESGSRLFRSLEFAVTTGSLKIVKYLTSKGARDEELDLYFTNTLKNVIELKQIEILKYLIRKKLVNLNSTFPNGCTALHSATGINSREILNILLDNGMDINDCSNNKTPLLYFAIFSHATDIINYLVSKGADINHKDQSTLSYLHTVVCLNMSEVLITVLLNAGAEINIKDSNGNTPLHSAVALHRYEHVKILLYNGADVNCKNIDNYTPLDLAKAFYDENIIKILTDFKAVSHSIIDLKTFVGYTSIQHYKDYDNITHSYYRHYCTKFQNSNESMEGGIEMTEKNFFLQNIANFY